MISELIILDSTFNDEHIYKLSGIVLCDITDSLFVPKCFCIFYFLLNITGRSVTVYIQSGFLEWNGIHATRHCLRRLTVHRKFPLSNHKL